MVAPKAKNIFLIDTTFILERTAKAFLGAPLLVVDGKDHTFTYGFMRDLLRLRCSVGIQSGILVVGKEGYEVASEADIKGALAFVQSVGLPIINRANRSTFDLCRVLVKKATHLVTDDVKLCQLSIDSVTILRPKATNEIEASTPATIASKIGVLPPRIPTFLALHGDGKDRKRTGPLTKRQAVRLVELYGDLEDIYANLGAMGASAVREKLGAHKDTIQRRYEAAKGKSSRIKVPMPGSVRWNVNSKRVEQLLHAHSFHSLVRILPLPSDATVPATAEAGESHQYKLVRDSKSLRQLESKMLTANLCALDTESDDKDPRKATLLGVALSVTKGEAYFLPILERDLDGISPSQVITFLKTVLRKQLRVVGHNLKYDALLFRRNGVEIKNIHFDTMLAAYECYGDWDFFNLAFIVERLLKKRIKSYGEIVKKHQTFLDVPLKEMKDHGCQDADVALQLCHVLEGKLKSRKIRDQFDGTTLSLMRSLLEHEYSGIPVNEAKLSRERDTLLMQIETTKTQVLESLGRKFDLDSSKDLSVALRDHLGLSHAFGPKSVSLRRLEELAIVHPSIRTVVEYKRLRKQLRRIESVAAATKGGKIYPLFNQIRSISGQLYSSDPSLFENDGLESLKTCVASQIREFFPDRSRAIDTLQDKSGDKSLLSDRSRRKSGNRFVDKHPVMTDLGGDDVLLSVVCGMSSPAMSRRFMKERMAIETMCHDLRMRYGALFDWVQGYRAEATRCGYATGPRGRKYLDGLRSSSVEKRKKASDAVVRWFVG